MATVIDILKQNSDRRFAIYGLSAETERFLKECSLNIDIVGLLDGFKEEGSEYGYPIISLNDAVESGVSFILVISRPGSCKAITKRIGKVCEEKNILLFDIRGRDLLKSETISYDFSNIHAGSKNILTEKINNASVISFDLFDTLIMRKASSYTDVFGILEAKLEIPQFAKTRLASEKECSKDHAPTLAEIYVNMQNNGICLPHTPDEMAELEWEIDFSIMTPRTEMCDIFQKAVKDGKRVVITTDCYYNKAKIEALLNTFEIGGYENLYVSCEENTSKTQDLFSRLIDLNGGSREGILHIGDDEYADIECAEKYEFETFRVFSAMDLFDHLGGLGTENETDTLSDRIKVGLFVSRLFNDPFEFEKDRLSVSNSYDIGYLFCAPIIADFTIWLKKAVKSSNMHQILFCARDGYLLEKLYKLIDDDTVSLYFLTSRTAAIRAGMENEQDIAYVDDMKYFGSDKENLKVRFGIDAEAITDRNQAILDHSKVLRDNYEKYISALGTKNGKSAMVDFVARGTTQMYLQKLFPEKIRGFYFVWLEPILMKSKGLEIEPFYSEEEKDTSAIFDNYYILETILTAPYPSIDEFDANGDPVYAKETRSERDIRCFERAQDGISAYFKDYLAIVPECAIEVNKGLDEAFLKLINAVNISDEDFIRLTVEDPFFGRMTAVKDIIG